MSTYGGGAEAEASEDEEMDAQQRPRPRRWGADARGRGGGEAKAKRRAVALIEDGTQKKARPAAMAVPRWRLERQRRRSGFGRGFGSSS